MRILSAHNRAELLATPHLVRFEYAQERDGHEPTLPIRGSTLLSEYVVLDRPMQLRFRSLGDRLLCGLEILNDGAWSLIQSN